jgi:hypothetical protein
MYIDKSGAKMTPGKYILLVQGPWGSGQVDGDVYWKGAEETVHQVNGAAMTDEQFELWQDLTAEEAKKFTHSDGKFGYYFIPRLGQHRIVLPIFKLHFEKLPDAPRLKRCLQVRRWDWRRDAPTNPR